MAEAELVLLLKAITTYKSLTLDQYNRCTLPQLKWSCSVHICFGIGCITQYNFVASWNKFMVSQYKSICAGAEYRG